MSQSAVLDPKSLAHKAPSFARKVKSLAHGPKSLAAKAPGLAREVPEPDCRAKSPAREAPRLGGLGPRRKASRPALGASVGRLGAPASQLAGRRVTPRDRLLPLPGPSDATVPVAKNR